MPKPKKPKKPRKAPTGKKRGPARPAMSPERAKLVDELVRKLRREVAERVGPNATFEQQSDASFEIMRDVLHRAEEERLQELVTEADPVWWTLG